MIGYGTAVIGLGMGTSPAARGAAVASAACRVAPQAQVTASSSFSDEYPEQAVADGVIRIHEEGEWACQGSTQFWGAIRYPWLQLTWPETQTIDRVVLYDRPTENEHTAGGLLEFSDGSEVRVFAIPNDGSPKTVTFPAKRTEWVKFVVTDGVGANLGLSEMEVFSADASQMSPVDWVDPTIETTRGRWFACAPGSRPSGMVSAAPFTRNKNQWGGGYNYNSTEILGFAQIHGWIMSGINLMPTTRDVDPTLG